MIDGAISPAPMKAAPEGLDFPGRTKLATTLLIVYAALVVWGVVHHAMWRDEIQAWLIARDSADLPALLNNLRYEGHPALWYLVIWPLTRLGSDPALMQIPNVAFSIAAVALVLRWAPFNRWELTLFPFGYFVFFDYAVKSRSYALGSLLAMVACTLWPRRYSQPVLLAGVLALLANVHLVFAFLAVAFAAAVLVDRLRTIGWSRPSGIELLAAMVLAVGWGCAIGAAWPAPDAISGRSISADPLMLRIGQFATLAALIGPYRSVPAALLGAAATAVAFAAIWREPAAVVLLAITLALSLLLFLLFHGGNFWHRGPIFLAFVGAIWIARLSPRAQPVSGGAPGRGILGFVLTMQAVSGLAAWHGDLMRPLSAGPAVARHIIAQGWRDDPLVGSPDFAVATIVGHLGIADAYYGNVGRRGSFALWDRARATPRDAATMLQDADNLPRPTTLVTATPIESLLAARYGYREVARFDAAEPTERFILYRRE